MSRSGETEPTSAPSTAQPLAAPAPTAEAIFPPARWLAAYRSAWLPRDVVAGVTLAAYAIPVSLAYAGLAGLPPEVGLYGYLLGGLGYALLGSSRYLAVGPTSAISLMVGATVAPMAAADPIRFAQIATLAALVVALLSIVAWGLRLSTLTNFISETNLLGFKAGAALSIASTQLPGLFGVPGGGDHFFARLGMVADQLPLVDALTTAVGLTAIALLVLGDALLPGRPVALLVVALGIAVAALTPIGEAGIALVGRVPGELPGFALPDLGLRDVDGVLPLALACLLLAYIEGVSAARTFAERHGDSLDPRQELLGLGAANLLVALGGGYPVAGGLSQSAVNERAGARTPLALVFASATLALCIVFLSGLLQSLPRAVLAAVVLVAIKGLVDLPGIARLWRVSRFEFSVAMVALVGVLALGILKGILLAALASILMLLTRAAAPRVATLGRIPGTGRFADAARYPEVEPVTGVLIVRVEASLLYFNAEHVLRSILDGVRSTAGLRLVVCDLSSSPHVDLAGARMLGKLRDALEPYGIALRLAGVPAEARALLRADGLASSILGSDRREAIAEVVEPFAGPFAPPDRSGEVAPRGA